MEHVRFYHKQNHTKACRHKCAVGSDSLTDPREQLSLALEMYAMYTGVLHDSVSEKRDTCEE